MRRGAPRQVLAPATDTLPCLSRLCTSAGAAGGSSQLTRHHEQLLQQRQHDKREILVLTRDDLQCMTLQAETGRGNLSGGHILQMRSWSNRAKYLKSCADAIGAVPLARRDSAVSRCCRCHTAVPWNEPQKRSSSSSSSSTHDGVRGH